MAEIDTSEIVEAIQNQDIVLVRTPNELVEQVNTQLLRHINQQKGMTVYLTASKPYSTVRNVLEEKGIDISEMFFIDCITRTTGDIPAGADKCVFLNPESLTDISIALSEAVDTMSSDRERFLVLDTLSTLMLYNDEETVGKFAHSLSNKIRDWGIKSVMLTLEEEADEEVTSQIRQFCDRCIHVEK